MCLHLTNQKRKPPVKAMRVYKVYRSLGGPLVESKYRHNKYTLIKGRVITSNRRAKSVTKHERYWNSIDTGFHVFLHKKDAKAVYRPHISTIAEFSGSPQDFVAFGENNDFSAGAVFKKLKFIRFLQ